MTYLKYAFILLLTIFLIQSVNIYMNKHDVNPIDFKNFVRPKTPNYFLLCPKDYCKIAPNEISPHFDINSHELYKAWLSMIHNQARVTLLDSDSNHAHYQYAQRSLIFHFPDYIDVQFIPISEKSSTIAIYSRAKYGHSDFGVNRKRVKKWLQLLREKADENKTSINR